LIIYDNYSSSQHFYLIMTIYLTELNYCNLFITYYYYY